VLASILLPVRNGERYLRQALDSVVAAAGSRPYEVLVQDGLSTDLTSEIVNSHRANVKYVREADFGQTDALNRALQRSRGDVIGWLNADDLYLPHAIEVAAGLFEADPLADVVFGDYQVVNARSELLRHHRPGEWNWQRLYMKGNYIFTGATFFRREVFEQFGVFSTEYEYVADLEFFLRIGPHIRAVSAHADLGAFRYHTDSKSGSQRFRFCTEAASLRREHRPAGPLGRLACMRAQSELWAAATIMPIRYTKMYSRARRLVGRNQPGGRP
jgi:glycosyltransferase involved in cell wall biosynthesis